MLKHFLGLSFILVICSCQSSPETAADSAEAATAEQYTDTTIAASELDGTVAAPALLESLPQTSPTTDAEATPATNRESVSPSIPKAEEKEAHSAAAISPPTTEQSAATEAVPTEVPSAATSSDVSATPQVAPAPPYPDHSVWDAQLRKYVNSTGQVNYRAWQAARAALTTYLEDLSMHTPQSDWPASEVKAYWINAYNAFTVRLILDHYPLSSIRDLHGGNPWDVKWIKLGNATYSLNQIEHEILRPRFQDARIHFAVNCAAASCPPLHNRAFTADNTNALLGRLTRNFVRNAQYNTITEQSVQVSKIFEWYQEDFGDLRSYLNEYSTVEVSADTAIEFKEYDWALNGQ